MFACVSAAACLEPDMPSHNGAMAVSAATSAAEYERAEGLAAEVASFPERFGPTYMTDGA